MDLGMTGYQLVGGVRGSYAADAPVNNEVQVEETSNTLIMEWVCPVHAEVIAFGVVITEDFSAQATDPVVELKTAVTVGGTETSLKALTLGNSSATTITKGDGTLDNQTALAADTDLDTGAVVFANLSGVDRVLTPGQVLIFQHTTAATGAGGAYVPFAIVRFSGPDFRLSNVWRELQTGEAVGD